MSEREEQVYKAKLAEQAERYDGTLHCIDRNVVSSEAVHDNS